MQFIEHSFGSCLECRRKQIVQVLLVFGEDARDSDGAAFTSFASASCHALDLISAAVSDSLTGNCTLFGHRGDIPVFESCMGRCEVCYPLGRLGNDLLVHTVFKIFLCLRI